MARSFGIVEDKVVESAYFLSKLEESISERGPFYDAQFILSAFLSSSRSITFAMQASLSDLEGFDEWYKEQQQILKANKLAKFFLEARNLSQKVGHYLIGGESSRKGNNGEDIRFVYFREIKEKGFDYVPSEDVRECCKEYFKVLLKVVLSCYSTFGYNIDPVQFFTIENFRRSGRTIEDFEEQAGYPRGYTAVPGISIEDRIALLQRTSPKPSPSFDEVLIVYLGLNRFGEQVELEN